MTDHDDSDPRRPGDDAGRIEEPRSEGVRIIGAQEAADAAGRSGTARRRRQGEKRYGDRPDAPDSTDSLPTVRISTSDPDDFYDDAGLGASPVVQPSFDEPRWADDAAIGGGHARALPADPEPAQASSSADAQDERPLAEEPRRPDVKGSGHEDLSTDPFGAPDDSFVLPHWTEPPTGQVPRVVVGDDLFDEEASGTHPATPRWRDEGERDLGTDFDDLLEDAPRLGALGGDRLGDDPFGDDPFDDDLGFDPEPERDPIEAFAPDDEVLIADRPTMRRARARRTEADDAAHGSGGHGGGIGGDRNLVMAVAVGVGLVVLGLVCFSLGGLATTVLACVIVGLAAYEFFGTVEDHGFHPAALLGLVATVGLLLATYTSGLMAYPVVLALTVVLGLVWYLWVQPGQQSVIDLGITLLGVMWIGFLGSFATLFLGLGKIVQDRTGASSNIGIGVLIAAVVVAVSHDVGAYFVGRYMGKTPLSATSPNKTLEGTAGGVVTAVIVTVVVVGAFSIAPIGGDIFRVFVFALLCALVAPLGDLCESLVKRDLGIKDMGSILPGHGGVLDRFDALLFVLPTAFLVTLLFGTWTH
ncbi:MAG: CDP-archaeol synthase [Actinobacteria bacterium]|nr:CDP-archaeol synthase [Actinomycetota bacterium]